MKKVFNKIICGIGLALSLALPSATLAQGNFNAIGLQSISTNTLTITNLTLLTNATKVAQIQLLGGGASGYMVLYDNNVTNMTYTNAQYVASASFLTNLPGSYISPVSGTTNLFTNLVNYTYMVTNVANTNNLPTTVWPVQANTLATYNVNLLNEKGISIYTSTNMSVIIRYRPND